MKLIPNSDVLMKTDLDGNKLPLPLSVVQVKIADLYSKNEALFKNFKYLFAHSHFIKYYRTML